MKFLCKIYIFDEECDILHICNVVHSEHSFL